MWDAIKELLVLFGSLFQHYKSEHNDVITRIASIYDSMGSITNNKAFDVPRVLIGKTHNGGGDLRADSPIFMSVIHEEVRQPMHSVKTKYQGIQVDSTSIFILQQMMAKGYYDIEVAAMAESFLKDLYNEEKIARVRVYFLKKTKKGLWFISFATINELQSFNQLDFKVAAKLAVANIKSKI